MDWLKQFDTFCFLDSHQYPDPYGQFEWIAAAGAEKWAQADTTSSVPSSLETINELLEEKDRWWFGHLSYGLKENFHGIPNRLRDPHQWKPFAFFSPTILIRFHQGVLTIHAADPDVVFEDLHNRNCNTEDASLPQVSLRASLTQEEYIHIVSQIQDHIQQGDCYEMNFCQEFHAENVKLSPLSVYAKLSELSPTPFAACYRSGPHWLISASPERFLARRGSRLISQPIKGTARREKEDVQKDEQLKRQLQGSVKERSENVMIVDLVRNDLSRVCRTGTVSVEELFGVYSFSQVHHLISTVSGELQPRLGFSEILQATFPMGSMTGAPKKRVLELTEQYEKAARGLYSGSVGYINPEGDFDFNVVIRSLCYREDNGYLSYHVGGGITAGSNPVQEWDECQLKAKALLATLGVNSPA